MMKNIFTFLDNPRIELPVLIKPTDRKKVWLLPLISLLFFVLGIWAPLLLILSFLSLAVFCLSFPFMGITKNTLDKLYTPILVSPFVFFPIYILLVVGEKILNPQTPVRKLQSYQLCLSLLQILIDWGSLLLGVMIVFASILALASKTVSFFQ